MKGRGFKEIIYHGSKGPDAGGLVDQNGLSRDMTSSDYFLEKLRTTLLKFEDDSTLAFLNNLFNYLNDVSAELFTILKE